MTHDVSYYQKIQGTNGVNSHKEASVRRAKRAVVRDWKNNYAWEQVVINGEARDVKILKTAEKTHKRIKSKPDEILKLGEIVKWRDTYWIIRSLDPDDKIQYTADIFQCNLILRWKLDDGTIHEEYAEGEDASKYGSGVDVTNYMELPYFTVKARVQANEFTLNVKRDKRFLIGPIGEEALSNPRPFKLTRVNDVIYRYCYEEGVQKSTGYVEWTMTEDLNLLKDDDFENGVAADPANAVPDETPIGGNTDNGEWFG